MLNMIYVKDNGHRKNCKKIGELTNRGHQVLMFKFDGYNTTI